MMPDQIYHSEALEDKSFEIMTSTSYHLSVLGTSASILIHPFWVAYHISPSSIKIVLHNPSLILSLTCPRPRMGISYPACDPVIR